MPDTLPRLLRAFRRLSVLGSCAWEEERAQQMTYGHGSDGYTAAGGGLQWCSGLLPLPMEYLHHLHGRSTWPMEVRVCGERQEGLHRGVVRIPATPNS